MKKYTESDLASLQSFGINLPLEFILKNYLGLSAKQITEFKQQQINDARHRYLIAITESGRNAPNLGNVIPFVQPPLESA